VIIFTALLVYFQIGKPVLFCQVRPGKDEKLFSIYKFRTMIEARDENGNFLSDEARLTDLGRWLRKLSLDEFPQLFNVLKGEMSFVGPRPLLIEYLELYNDKQRRRHNVLPGITGWAQVNGRNAISWEDKFALDVWYVEHLSFMLDMKIMCLTLGKVIQGSDVSSQTTVTMEKFEGNQ
jgi:undecaprenyl phosphate N,N'-diacetylbacillosamine 1-phosphate transferase